MFVLASDVKLAGREGVMLSLVLIDKHAVTWTDPPAAAAGPLLEER
jgi:hypothetical protein